MMLSGIIFFYIFMFLILAFLQKIMYRKEIPDITKFDIKKLRAKFKVLIKTSNVAAFIIAAIAIFAIVRYMLILQHSLLQAKGVGVVYSIGVSWIIFLVPAFFIGSIISGIIMGYIVDFIGRKLADNAGEWDVFYYDYEQKWLKGFKIDTRKLSNLFAMLLFPFFIMLYLALNSYIVVENGGIRYRSYSSLKEKNYPFNDLQKILFISKFKNNRTGNTENLHPYYLIIMRDGSQIDIVSSNLNITNAKEKEMVDYISKKTSVPVQEAIRNIDDK